MKNLKIGPEAVFALLSLLLLAAALVVACQSEPAPGGPVPVQFEWYGE